jgi:hypothetical protein
MDFIINGRHVTIAPCGTTAWFDETLFHVTFGECRGSGILICPPKRLWSTTASLPTANTNTATAAAAAAVGGGGGSCHTNHSRWKIAQYNLIVPIPNALMNNVARQIGDYHKMKKQTNSTTSTTMMMTANNDSNSKVDETLKVKYQIDMIC